VGQVMSYEQVRTKKREILVKQMGQARFHIKAPLGDALPREIGIHRFRRARSADESAIDGSVGAVVATDIDAGTDANGSLGRFQGTGQLLRLGMSDAIAAE